MLNRFLANRPLAIALSLLIVAAVGFGVYRLMGRDRLPAPDSKVYQDMVSAFYVGTIALQTGEDGRAGEKLTLATQLVPREPAAWANLGLFHLRQGNLDAAAEHLETAHRLVAENARIEAILGLLRTRQGRFDEAITHLRRASALDPQNLRTRYALAQVILQQGQPDSEAEAQRLMEEILQVQPDNIIALLERARHAARRGDKDALRDSVARLERPAREAGPETLEQHPQLARTAAGPDPGAAAVPITFLGNLLKPLYAYKVSVAAVQPTSDEPPAEPLQRFLVLPTPTAAPAPPDTALAFAAEPLPGAGKGAALRVVPLGVEEANALFVADGQTLRRADAPGTTLPFPGGAEPPTPEGIRPIATGYDFRNDLALAGAGGLRLYKQDEGGAFTDVTARMALPPALLNAPYHGAWAADLEADGDLDLVLGTASGAPLALRNNSDGTWTPLRPFADVSGLRAFAWVDLDGDGVQEACLVDGAGALHVFMNERSGRFRARTVPAEIGAVSTLAVGDIGNRGSLGLIALRADGAVLRLSDRNEGADWEVTEVVPAAENPVKDPTARLFVADLDNNGGLDLVVSGAEGGRVWLSDGEGRLRPQETPLEARVFSVADLNGDGRLDLIGLSPDGQPLRLVNRGTKNYHWQLLRPHAIRNKETALSQGQLVNPFGVGGEIEVRSALLYQRQPIEGPRVHFGLGEHPQAQAVRILWPNGTLRAEFDLDADQSLEVEQRLKTSCPFLFAWNGKEMGFVTDCIWRSPLGLKINAQDTAGVMQTEDWVRIRGDQLAPKEGAYDLRVTAELWETHFFDHLSLMSVDHPEGTEVWVDERLAFPQPPLKVYATKPSRPFARVRDDRGNDVSETVRARDGSYLMPFERGRFQGVTRDHWVEMELPEDAPRDRPLWLLAYGWIRPTNSSINVAIGQSRHDPPRGLSLEVPDGRGGWTTAQPGLGFPEGKVKTILVSLDGVFRPGTERKLRLRTNLEIYWDTLSWAEALPDSVMKTRRILARSAELRYRGYSFITQADDSSPELPEYDRIAGRTQRWRDLTGFYTRFGDVRELLEKVDDRYVIMNAGDELALTFAAPPPPPAGWVRDFVFIGDGWVKDGDYNTTFGKTVLPLPAHDITDYDIPPGRLEDDPVYRRHAADWKNYHTRYVRPHAVLGAMRP